MRSLAMSLGVLEPLEVRHAAAMFELLGDPELHRYTDDEPPPSLAVLAVRYEWLQSRLSPDGREHWLNWVVMPAGEPAPAGYVQATVKPGGDAWVAYVLGRAHWGRGLARGAMQAMLPHLAECYGARRCLASVEAANLRSLHLLDRLGFSLAPPDDPLTAGLSATERLFIRPFSHEETPA